ncbi:MAG: SpoIIE family protein phosphatase [Spirochaetes bacterium]|nr:SpoIIE family protein phosphatase [Spirochaetota bacterium]
MKKLWLKIVPAISPGIRLKLTVFTIIFVSALILASFIFTYLTQKRELSRAMSEQVKAPEQLVSGYVGDLHRFTEALIQLENFRVRLKKQTQEAQKFRKVVVTKNRSLGNKIWGAFGGAVRYSYNASSYATYYSTYLTEKNLKEFEGQLKTALDAMLPAPLDVRAFINLKNSAARAVYSQNAFTDALDAANDSDKDDKFRRLQERADNDRAALTSSIAKLLDPLLQAKLDSMQFSRQAIRLLSYGDIEARFRSAEKQKDGSYKTICKNGVLPRTPLLDTAPRGTAAGIEDWALLRNADFIKFTRAVFCDGDNYFSQQTSKNSESGKDIRLEKSLYSVDFSTVPKQPAVVERVLRIMRAEQEESPLLKKFAEIDEKSSAELKPLAAKKRERLDALREKGTPPYKDKEFMAAAREYQTVQERRDAALLKAVDYAQLEKAHFAGLAKRIQGSEADFKAGKTRLAEIENLLAKSKRGQAPKDTPSVDELERRAESEKQHNERIQADLAQLRTYSGSFENVPGATSVEIAATENLLLAEALLHLRDAALYGRVRLALASEQQLLLREKREAAVRQAILKNFAAIRRFVHEARSETELPLMAGRVSPIAGGVLAVTRSEAEESMHEWDSTPLLGSKGLVRIFRNENIAGYNMIVVDKTRGLDEIVASTQRLLLFSGIIALVAIAAAWFFSGFAVRRLQSLSATSSLVKSGNLQVHFDGRGYDELATLGQSLNGMVEGLKEREELKGELMAAEEIQKRLLPATVPANLAGRADVAGFYKAMVGIGGDYFDYVPLGADHVAIAMGDVSSHGVGPALVMAITRSQLHAQLREKEISLKTILLKLNQQLYAETPAHMFVTFFLGLYNLKTGELQYISAGHSKPLFYSTATGKTKYLEAGGMPLGMDDNDFFATTMELKKTALQPGDIFVQYTDGLSEAMNPAREQFGYDRMEQVLATAAKAAAEPILQALAHAVENFAQTKLDQPGPSALNDDIALVCLKRT